MKKNLPQKSNRNLSGFEQRLTIGSELLNQEESNNDEVYFHFMCGKNALFENRVYAAIEYFNKVITYFENISADKRFIMKLGRKVPYDEYVNSLLLRGNANYSLQNENLAIKDYSKCIVADNSNIGAYRNRAICYMNTNLIDYAIKDFSVIVKLKEYCPEIHRYLGYCYEKIKDKNNSKLHFSIAADQGDKESIKTLIDDK